MSSEQYDDLDPVSSRRRSSRRHRRRQGNAGTIAVILIFILFSFFLFLFLTGNKEPKKDVSYLQEVKQPQVVDKNKIIENPRVIEKPQVVEQPQVIEKPQVIIETKEQEIYENPNTPKLKYTQYIIKEGDNIKDIAYSYKLKPATVLSVNKAINPQRLKDGQVISIPNVDGVIYTVRHTDSLKDLVQKFSPQLTLEQYINFVGKKGATVITGEELFFPTQVVERKLGDNIKITRPIEGDVTYVFNQIVGDRPSKGIYIRPTKDLDVHCSLKGKVIDITYLPNIGKALIIKSSNYKITYGNLQKILVNINSEVDENDIIGKTKDNKTNLYFEVTNDDVEVNPENLF